MIGRIENGIILAFLSVPFLLKYLKFKLDTNLKLILFMDYQNNCIGCSNWFAVKTLYIIIHYAWDSCKIILTVHQNYFQFCLIKFIILNILSRYFNKKNLYVVKMNKSKFSE